MTDRRRPCIRACLPILALPFLTATLKGDAPPAAAKPLFAQNFDQLPEGDPPPENEVRFVDE